MKSPLRERYPTKTMDALLKIIPPASKVNTFNLYGAHLSLNLAEQDRIVIGNTNRYVVYEFWKCALENPTRIAEMAEIIRSHNFLRGKISEILQERWAYYPNPYLRAALFFLLNNHSIDGAISTGAIHDSAFSPFAANTLRQLSVSNFYLNFYDTNSLLEFDFSQLRTDFILFPIGKFSYNLFEHGRAQGLEEAHINHEGMRDALKQMEQKTLFLYKMHPQVPRLYSEFNQLYLDVYGRPTDNLTKAREVIVANFGIN
jgi:hypothetical protein